MNTKTIEIRDRATFIPALAIRLGSEIEADRFLCARSGYGITRAAQSEYILLMKLNGRDVTSDPYEWDDRTMRNAHAWLVEHFDDVDSGDVVDVEFILGEKTEPAQSERLGE